MEMTVNGQKVSFKLEQEQNLIDLCQSVQHWADQNKLYLTDISFDGTSWHESDREFMDRKPEAIDRVAVEVQQQWEHRIATVEVLYQYFSTMAQQLAQLRSDPSQSSEPLTMDLGFLWENINLFSKLEDAGRSRNEGPRGPWRGNVDKLITLSSSLATSTAEQRSKTLQAMNTMVQAAIGVIKQRLAEVYDPSAKMAEYLQLLKQMKPALEDAGTQLMGSEAPQGMNTIQNFTECYSSLVRSHSWLLERTENKLHIDPVGQLRGKIDPLLEELAQAMDDKDPVTISDILAYDVVPALDEVQL